MWVTIFVLLSKESWSPRCRATMNNRFSASCTVHVPPSTTLPPRVLTSYNTCSSLKTLMVFLFSTFFLGRTSTFTFSWDLPLHLYNHLVPEGAVIVSCDPASWPQVGHLDPSQANQKPFPRLVPSQDFSNKNWGERPKSLADSRSCKLSVTLFPSHHAEDVVCGEEAWSAHTETSWDKRHQRTLAGVGPLILVVPEALLSICLSHTRTVHLSFTSCTVHFCWI